MLVLANGDVYRGEFVDDTMHGLVIFTGAGGERYEGEFQSNQMHGKGILVMPNGQHYEGDFADGLMQGTGTYTWPDDKVYSGAFEAGAMHGAGTFSWKNGQRHEGLYAAGKREGWVYLRKAMGGWKRRFVSLRGSKLTVYRDASLGVLKAELEIKDAAVEPLDDVVRGSMRCVFTSRRNCNQTRAPAAVAAVSAVAAAVAGSGHRVTPSSSRRRRQSARHARTPRT